MGSNVRFHVNIVLFLVPIVIAITNHDFRFISYKDLHPSVHWFPLDGVTSYSQILFDVSRNQIFVGARDALYKLHLSKLELLEVAHWEAPTDKIDSCIFKGQDEENCHNFIKILLTSGSQIFACGTNAFSPLCSWRNIDNISNVTQVISGIAKCPHNPAASVTGFISDSFEYFFGGSTDFSGSDFLVSKNLINGRTLRTKQYNSFWLNDPQFVGSFETSKFAYFLFRETAVEYINCGKVVYSRIARVCKNDQGGHTMLKENWTTFIKARLNCSVSGDYPFYYNEIQSVYFVPEENVMYATFTTPPNNIAGSAVCAFDMAAIDDAFNGPFKYQHDMNSAWTRHYVPNREHLDCKLSKYNNLIETSKYQLMDNAVQATTLNPLFVSDLERFSHITVDVVLTKHHRVHVIYVATNEGFIKKLTMLQHREQACSVEIWEVASEYQPIIKNMQFLKETNSIYATTDNGLIKIEAAHCTRHLSKESCLNSMDPYCGWNELEDKCTMAPGGDPHHKYWKQLINTCPVLNTPINGGWSSWSNWYSCNFKSSKSDNDLCLCQTRQCDNPAPANDGLSCEGPSITVTNCTIHGGWTEWSPWSTCSSSCGMAVKTRFRTCTNPAPAFGGRVCVGQDILEASCDVAPCPIAKINGGWSAWSNWSPCSASCGGGFRSRQRKCDNPVPQYEGHYCKGNDVEYDVCNEKSCDEQKKLQHTEWITDYNISRKGYHQKRFRITCKAPVEHSNHIKITVKEETQVCLSNKCEKEDDSGWSSWSSWSECSTSCGGGTQYKTRYCHRDNCLGPSIQTKDCNKHDCEDNWGCWSEWSPCNVSCGWGIKTRHRTCLGQKCKGTLREEEPCQDQPCENILGWGNWTEWSECDEESLQYRKRTCYTENPGPYMCQGNSVQTRMCVGNQLNSDCSCVSVGLNMFFFGVIIGLAPGTLWLCHQTIKRKKNRVPSSPHYITSDPNQYSSIPIRRKAKLSKQNSYSGSSTIKSKFDIVHTLKRQSNDFKNGTAKAYYDSDHLYE